MARTYIRPSWFMRTVVNGLMGMGSQTFLTVAGRASGKPQRVPVHVLEHDGARYLVAPRGDTDWSRNLRAAGRGMITAKSRKEAITVTEVDDGAKPPLIAAYRAQWDAPTKRQWEALPDPADHPIFRIQEPSADPAEGS